jgi:hypothetical protein
MRKANDLSRLFEKAAQLLEQTVPDRHNGACFSLITAANALGVSWYDADQFMYRHFKTHARNGKSTHGAVRSWSYWGMNFSSSPKYHEAVREAHEGRILMLCMCAELAKDESIQVPLPEDFFNQYS